MGSVANAVHREPWNKGKIVGQKAPFKLKDIWALRVRLQWKCHFDAAEPPRGPGRRVIIAALANEDAVYEPGCSTVRAAH